MYYKELFASRASLSLSQGGVCTCSVEYAVCDYLLWEAEGQSMLRSEISDAEPDWALPGRFMYSNRICWMTTLEGAGAGAVCDV